MHPQVALPLPHVVDLNLQIPLQLHHLKSPNIDAAVFEHFILLINLLLELLTGEFFALLG